MRITVKNATGEPLFGLDVPLDDPPTVVNPPNGKGREMTLHWERALDDEKHLRHFIICGCPDLYARKPFPQATIFTLVVLATVIATVLYGFNQVALAVTVLTVVLAIDLFIDIGTS